MHPPPHRAVQHSESTGVASVDGGGQLGEPRLRASPGHTSDSVTVTVVRTGSTWQVDAATICGAYTTIGLLDRCP
ncbi:hypothetical protein MXD61_09405 [Frankia sp. AgPm24]|uniref:hypothetical protein n=1 Tax=Frankia sp. AgPm24 TaxID=631128 RepID=UPI002010BA86|nr:hypothetical protein [Frankia sp. AgPm24]MCK9922095.1 hypothetical protein [Frankia sp. AgPm24]